MQCQSFHTMILAQNTENGKKRVVNDYGLSLFSAVLREAKWASPNLPRAIRRLRDRMPPRNCRRQDGAASGSGRGRVAGGQLTLMAEISGCFGAGIAMLERWCYTRYLGGDSLVLRNNKSRGGSSFNKETPSMADAYLSHFWRGEFCFKQGWYDEAIASYNKAIDLDPDFAVAYRARGEAYHKKKEHGKAIADQSKAIDLDPRFADAYRWRGITYARTGEFDKAIADQSKAIELNPGFADAYVGRGDAYIEKGESDKAIADYGKAIELNSSNADAYVGRGLAYVKRGERDKALAEFNKAVEADSSHAWAYLGRGVIYGEQRKYDYAIESLTQTIRLGKHNSVLAKAYFERGRAFEAAGNRKGAKKDFKKARALVRKMGR